VTLQPLISWKVKLTVMPMSTIRHLRSLPRLVSVTLLGMSVAAHAASDCDSVTVEYDPDYPPVSWESRERTKLIVERCNGGMREKDATVDEYFRAVQSVLVARQVPKAWGMLPIHSPNVRVTVVNGGQKTVMVAPVNDDRLIYGVVEGPREIARFEGMKEIVALTQRYLAARYRFTP
jgi:hypothetical protein